MSPLEPSKTLRPGFIEKDIANYLPVLDKIANIDIITPLNLDSSNIGPEQWRLLHQLISDNYSKYDGFVIIHGTDTLVYTAAAISFLCRNNDKPVIFTGSQRPLSAIRSDARSNLINSVELATMNIPDIAVCFSNQLFRGNRTRKLSIESYQGFDSPNYPPLARLGLNIQINHQLFLKDKSSFSLKPDFKNNIMVIPLFPGLDFKPFINIIESDISSIILSGFGAGNIPDQNPDWIRFVELATKNNKLVFISSQSPHGMVDLDLYECGRKAREAGAHGLMDMTLETAVVKMMLLNANYKDNDKIRQIMIQPIAGEVSEIIK